MPNNVTVESDLDKNLKPLKVGNTATSIEVACSCIVLTDWSRLETVESS